VENVAAFAPVVFATVLASVQFTESGHVVPVSGTPKPYWITVLSMGCDQDACALHVTLHWYPPVALFRAIADWTLAAYGRA
jgi:hypothetical protein